MFAAIFGFLSALLSGILDVVKKTILAFLLIVLGIVAFLSAVIVVLINHIV